MALYTAEDMVLGGDDLKNVDITTSQVTILIEIDGQVHLVGMPKDDYKIISELIKRSIVKVIPTSKTQTELRLFFGLK